MPIVAPEVSAKDVLLARSFAYVLERGLADLSLRPLGAAVGASPRTLLYHFGSKERLVAELFERTRRTHLEIVDAWCERSADYRDATLLIGAWQWLSAPRHERLMRLGLEAQALASRDRRRHGAFTRGMLLAWSSPLARRLEHAGFERERATTLATLLAATIRGLLAELATSDRPRLDRVFRSFVAAIEFPTSRASA